MIRLIGRFLLWGFAAIGITIVAVMGAFAFWLGGLADAARDLPDRMVLSLNLNKGVTETQDGGPLRLISTDGPQSLRHILAGLEKAAKDDRVGGVAVRLGATRVGLAHAQEIRKAVQRFRKSGKFAVAYADSFGMLQNGTVEYYLASAFDEVWMQPSGELALTGLAIEVPFAAGVLEKIGVEPKIDQRYEYKSAPETFMRRGFSGPARQNLQQLVDSWFDQIVTGIARERGLEAAEVRAIVDASPLLSSEARARKLVDTLDYWPQFAEAAKTRYGKEAGWVTFERYIDEGDLPNSSGPTVALIYGIGPILPGGGKRSPLDGDRIFAAETVAKAIRAAAAKESVKAILLRINSPGGSYVASDTVWSAIQHARSKGKPVIASMAGIAASGGYFVAMAADKIVAERGTVTGSIGVYGGKFDTQGLWSKLGINWEQVHAGRHATMWSPFRGYPPGAEARVDASLDFVYRDFTAKAAKARNLTDAQIDAVARGRVWTGEAALNNGLIDRLGGLAEAISVVKEALDLAPDDEIMLQQMPRPQTPFEQLLRALSSGQIGMVAMLAEWLGMERLSAQTLEAKLGPLADDLELLRPPVGRLQMPPIRLRR
ncbi:MAG: signal peptide peptidase SppA [Alphaproteobacteria bacterium]|nr:signal peptide peptidase SppA [Alphaproteobacteria bacterium]